MKRFICLLMALALLVGGVAALAEDRGGMGGGPDGGGRTNDGNPGGGRMGGGPDGGGRMGGGGGMAQNDAQAQAVLDANAAKFSQFTFADEQTGISFDYSLFVPEDYDAAQAYPLIMFIPDATGAGKSAEEIVAQYYGAAVWASDEEQAKHPCFVLVPAFTVTVTNDNWEADPQIDAAVKLIEQLRAEYAIDEDRLYTTGQSMGCMSSLYLNGRYPDLFAASLYVSGQWDISVLSGMENQKFFYVTAGGDAKASGGQDEVMAMFDADGVPYAYGSWSAQDSAEAQNAAVAALLSQGLDANMIRFETGTVLGDGQNGMEHMASFNYAYKLTAVRDWLFEQSRQ